MSALHLKNAAKNLFDINPDGYLGIDMDTQVGELFKKGIKLVSEPYF